MMELSGGLLNGGDFIGRDRKALTVLSMLDSQIRVS